MSKSPQRTSKHLESLRLPDLQAHYARATGKSSRSPNRTFLIRAILEVEKSAKRASVPPSKPRRNEAATAAGRAPAASIAPVPGAVSAKPARGRYSKMEISELREKYLEVVGRPTGSSDRGYLVWKLREADKGKIPLGPRATSVLVDAKTIPLRLSSSSISDMDNTWATHGFRSRTEFLRNAIAFYANHCRTEGRPPSEARA